MSKRGLFILGSQDLVYDCLRKNDKIACAAWYYFQTYINFDYA
jgi:hypothetical protein